MKRRPEELDNADEEAKIFSSFYLTRFGGSFCYIETDIDEYRNLKEYIIPFYVTELAPHAFAGCVSLSHVYIPDDVNIIGSGAFEGCKSLNNVIIPERVNKILSDTFRKCKSLTNIIIPNSVTIIEQRAFSHCKSLHTHTHTITCYMGYAHYAFHGDINENDKRKIFTKILTNNNKLNISKVN